MPRVHLLPVLSEGPDQGNGGIHRVLVGQYATLPKFGWEIVANPAEADVIACHVEVPPAYLKLYADKPLVVHNHGLYWTDGNYGWESWCYTVNQKGLDAIRAADVVTAVSEWTAQALRRNTMRDVRVVYHGVDLNEWLPSDAREDYVLWNKTRVDPICDPQPMNDVATLLPAVQFISTFGKEARNVKLMGKLPFEQGRELVRRAGVYLATTRETFGIGTLEALAAGIPVVGFAFGGQREIIEHGVDGWLVPPGDIEGLAEGIQWALRHRDEIAPRAREKASRFPVERSGEEYARIYSEVLARSQAERPKVSVIVPAYKMGDWLDDTLRSIAAQSLEDWECIVVNDASPDPRDHKITADWCKRDSRFIEIVKPQNGYLAAARNTGIERARGRYIMPVDADDMIAPNTLEVLAHELDADRSLSIAYGNVEFVHPDGETPVVYPDAQQRGLPAGRSGWPVPFRLEWMLRGPGQLLPYASMFRREAWALTGGYRTRSRSSEDQDFWLRTTSYGFQAKMVTQATTLIYRVRPDSMSSAAGEGWEEHRPWFPWCKDRSLTPAGGIQEAPDVRTLPMAAYDPVAISVIIPVGPGHAPFVIDAVDSVDAQTFRHWECVVVNDSGEPLPPLPSWVRVVCSDAACPCIDGDPCHYRDLPDSPAMPWPKGRGVAAARNRGVRHSTGPLLLPLDADDILQPRALEIMLDVYLAQREPTVIYSDFYQDPEKRGEYNIYQTPHYDPRRLASHGALHAVTALTPRRFWEEVGGYDEDLAWEDWAFSIAIAAKGHCSRRVAAPLFTYRKWTGKRRNENLEDFERSKAAIMAKDFGLKQGGELLACQRCGAGQQTTAMQFMQNPGPGQQIPDGAVMIRYIGNQGGAQTYRSRANSGIAYRFGLSRPEGWVLADDVSIFADRPDFEIMRAVMPSAVGVDEVSSATPALIAAREPVLVGAYGAPTGTGPLEEEIPQQPHGFPDAATDAIEPDQSSGELVLTPAAQELVNRFSRDELNQMAANFGLDATSMPNKAAVAIAIEVRRSM